MEGLESQLAASALKRALPPVPGAVTVMPVVVPVRGFGFVMAVGAVAVGDVMVGEWMAGVCGFECECEVEVKDEVGSMVVSGLVRV